MDDSCGHRALAWDAYYPMPWPALSQSFKTLTDPDFPRDDPMGAIFLVKKKNCLCLSLDWSVATGAMCPQPEADNMMHEKLIRLRCGPNQAVDPPGHLADESQTPDRPPTGSYASSKDNGNHAGSLARHRATVRWTAMTRCSRGRFTRQRISAHAQALGAAPERSGGSEASAALASNQAQLLLIG